jgi:antitoxin ParD1/3/4
MNISLTSGSEGYIQSKVQSGMFDNASEVVEVALRRMHEADERYHAKLERLRAEVKIGIDDIEHGRVSQKSILDLINE